MSDQSQQPAGTPESNQPPGNAQSASQQNPTPPENQQNSPSSGTKEPPAEQGTDLGGDEKKPDEGTDLGSEDDGQKPAGEAAPEPWREFHGAPADEQGNPMDYQFTAPDGVALDEELAAEFAPVGRELNLSQKGAQKLVDLKVKDIQIQQKRWGDHVADLKKSSMEDKDIGGAKYGPTLAGARQAITKICGTRAAAFRQMCNQYGVGNHPEMLYMLGQVAKLTGEPAPAPSGEGGGATKPLHEILYKDP